jgi:lysine biosynthesis protein LysW
MIECPECGSPVVLRKGIEAGERVSCLECGETLEVVSVKPLEVNLLGGRQQARSGTDRPGPLPSRKSRRYGPVTGP